MEKFDKVAQTILEDFKPIKQVRRFFYPRNFTLSHEFLRAYELEKKRLLGLNFSEKEIQQKITKALMFH